LECLSEDVVEAEVVVAAAEASDGEAVEVVVRTLCFMILNNSYILFS
jgi:hypothetical protein